MFSQVHTKLQRGTEKISRCLRIYEAEASVAAEFRALQIKAILRLTPLTMLANL